MGPSHIWQVTRMLLSRARRVHEVRIYVQLLQALGWTGRGWQLERRSATVWLDAERMRAMRSWVIASAGWRWRRHLQRKSHARLFFRTFRQIAAR